MASRHLLALRLLAHILFLWLFVSGFFLTRRELPDRSSCEDASNPSVSCWGPPRYSKIVILIIDALRYDFVTGDPTSEHLAQGMPNTFQLTKSRPNHAVLVPIYADAPTVTMQRLKGITTGGLPTFLEVGENFQSSEIHEDNWIWQLRRQNHSIVFMGDDTWTDLFPRAFTRAYPFPSFNVKDLHTVDNGCIKHLEDELPRTDWSVLVAHFLGVDHAGHRYHADHPAMREKLSQMDAVVASVIRRLDKQPDAAGTLLLVLGDHGMTDDGNHGGATTAETEAALFAYSPGGRLGMPTAQGRWAQIDLVPTLSLLLGLPIPFGSLGTVISWLTSSHHDPSAQLEPLLVNAAQIHRYITTYFKRTSELAPDVLSACKEFQDLVCSTLSALPKHQQQVLTATPMLSQAAQGCPAQPPLTLTVEELCQRLRHWCSEALQLCRVRWTMFNWPWLVCGVLVGIVLCTSLCAWLWRSTFLTRCPRSHVRLLAAAAVALLAYMQGLFSNSFIVAEFSVCRFLLTSMVLARVLHKHYSLYCAARQNGSASKYSFVVALRDAVGLVFCVRCICSGQSTRPLLAVPTDVLGALLVFLPLVFAAVWLGTAGAGATRSHILCFGVLALHWALPSNSPALRTITPKVIVALTGLNVYRVTVRGRRGRAWSLLLSTSPVLMLLLGPKTPLVFVGAIAFFRVFKDFRSSEQPMKAAWRRSSQPAEPVPAGMRRRTSTIPPPATQQRPVLPSSPTGTDHLVLFDGVMLWFLQIVLFFGTGHGNSFSQIHTSSAFVLVDAYSPPVAFLSVFANTFAAQFLTMAALPLIFPAEPHRRGAMLVATTLCVLRTVLSAINVVIQRRHLMLWAIFAPKFIFDACIGAVVHAICCLLWTV